MSRRYAYVTSNSLKHDYDEATIIFQDDIMGDQWYRYDKCERDHAKSIVEALNSRE